MELSEFKEAYHETVSAIRQTHVAALVTSVVLNDFPKKLPTTTRAHLGEVMGDLAKALGEAVHELEQRSTGDGTASIPSPRTVPRSPAERRATAGETPDDPLVMPIVNLLLTRGIGRGDLLSIEFAPLLFAQDLVTTLAHLDGFTSHVLKACCTREPRLLRRRKQITWEDVLAAGSWGGLMQRMTEDYALEEGWKTLAGRLRHFGDEMGVEVKIDEQDLKTLDEAYQLRHVIVHGGGRVSREFLQRTGRNDVTLGQKLTIGPDVAAGANSAAVIVCGELFVAAAVKFFGISERECTGVWRRQKQQTPKSRDTV
jgi:hypothetical protein